MAQLRLAAAVSTLFVALPVAAPAGEPAPRVLSGRVTQVTAADLFINLGQRHGLQPGTAITVRLGHRKQLELVVEQVWWKGSRAALPPNATIPRVGARVRAQVTTALPARAKQKAKALPVPEDRNVVATRWNGVSIERPKLAPRASGASASPEGPAQRWAQGTLRLEWLGLINLGGSTQQHYQRMGVYSALDVDRLFVPWLSYSHRIRLRFDVARDLDDRRFQDSRPIPLIYRARIGIDYQRWQIRAGRFVGTPLPVATLTDGGSARVRIVDGLYVGAYGGGTPRPDDLAPGFDAPQFGTYASLRLASEPWARQRWDLAADVGFVGTMWDGQMDRQSVVGQVTLDWQPLWLHASATVDFFPSDHPGNLSTTLSRAAAEARASISRSVRLGARYDRYRFLPTRELLSVLPAEYIVSDAINSLRGSLEVDLPARLLVDVQGGWDTQDQGSQAGWTSISLRRIGLLTEADQLSVSGQLYRGHLLDGYGGRLAYYLPLATYLSTSGSYRLMLDENHLGDTTLRHLASLGLELVLWRNWLLTLDGTLQASDEERVLHMFSSVAWAF